MKKNQKKTETQEKTRQKPEKPEAYYSLPVDGPQT
jgi:hypothetical protein